MTLTQEIKYRRDREREAVDLATKYVREKNYEKAAEMYRSADFHRAVRKHLQASSR